MSEIRESKGPFDHLEKEELRAWLIHPATAALRESLDAKAETCKTVIIDNARSNLFAAREAQLLDGLLGIIDIFEKAELHAK